MQKDSLKGKFITIEGQDGAGKTTNINTICSYLDSKNIQYIQTREPGGTKLGEKIRHLILQEQDLRIDNTAELLLMFAARSQHLSELIKPTLKNGIWVVCDRFTDATIAYQGAGRGINQHIIKQLADIVHKENQPDLTILLDVDMETGSQRVDLRNQSKDRFETELSDFKQRVRAKYLQLANENPQRIKLINANNTLDTVTEQVNEAISDFCDRQDILG